MIDFRINPFPALASVGIELTKDYLVKIKASQFGHHMTICHLGLLLG